MEKVNILLSTYNGEKFLPIQLDSLLAQTYRNITIYIRDDMSSDSTVEIIKKYKKMADNGIEIVLIEDNEGNLGYVKSFLNIIRHVPNADYYAFCDQDDYWLPNKIEQAVKNLSKLNNTQCLLYTSSYSVCNEDMEIIGSWHEPTPLTELSVGKSLSLYDGGWLLGFTLVMNNRLKEVAFNNEIEDMYSHDIWAQAVVVGMRGTLYIDDQVTCYFRRHGNSTSIAESDINKSLIKAWKYRIKETFTNGEIYVRIKNGMISYIQQYKIYEMSKEDRDFINRFDNEKKGFYARFRKVFYPYRLKNNLLVEIAWRVVILFGKI